MALHFVSTSILSSDDGIDFSKEQQLESEETKKARVESEKASHKTLYEQLLEKQIKKQEEYDANTKLLHAPPKALDAEDFEFLTRLENENKIKQQHHAEEESKGLKEFKSIQRQSHQNNELAKTFIAPIINFPEKRKEEDALPNIIVKKKKIKKQDDVASNKTIESPTEERISSNTDHAYVGTDSHDDTKESKQIPGIGLFSGYGSDESDD